MTRCWIYRKAISVAADSQSQGPWWVQRHLRCCPNCRRFQEQEFRLTQALVAAADAHREEGDPFLHSQIMAALDRQPGVAPRPDVPWLAWVGSALVPAVGVVALAAYFGWRPSPTPASLPSDAPSVVQASPTFAVTTPDQLLALTEKWDQPLEGELHSVMADAKSALRSIGDNFLPSQFVAQAEH